MYRREEREFFSSVVAYQKVLIGQNRDHCKMDHFKLSEQRRIGCVALCLWEFHKKAVVRCLFICNFFVSLPINSIALCWGIFWVYLSVWGLLLICATSCLRILLLCFASVIDRDMLIVK